MSTTSALLQVLLEKYGRTSLTFEEAAHELNFAHIKTAYSARYRGVFPVRVLDLGGRLGCSIADLAEFLATGVTQKDIPSAPSRKKPGRPTNAERARRLSTEAHC